MFRALRLAAALTAAAALPVFPDEYSTVILMKMPYIGNELPMRVLTSKDAQKIEYYNGLQVDTVNKNGTFKYAYNNSERTCLYTPPDGPGPTALAASSRQPDVLNIKAKLFFPNLTDYTHAGNELVGGIMCEKYVASEVHGTTGTMSDSIAFYWDAVLERPVRWHMHSRQKVFDSHTDEWIFDYISFQAGAPPAAELTLPELCQQPRRAKVSVQAHGYLHAAHAAAAAAGSSPAHALSYEAFARRYSKAYTSEEHVRRRTIFEANSRLVSELNEKHAGVTTFKGNQFLDMTREEVLQFRGDAGKAPRAARRSQEDWKLVKQYASPVGLSAAPRPASFDWRSQRPGVVSPVKDQGMCGSCWAYGLLGPVESMFAIQTGRSVSLQEQFVVDCTWTAPMNGTGPSNNGCDGGDSDVGAFEIIRKYGGVVPSSKAYGSYLNVDGYCKDIRKMDVAAKISGWVDIPPRDEDTLLHALVKEGPIEVSIMVPDEMLYYDSGVLKVESCRHKESEIDHSVVLVGYGTDESGTDYYTIRNSWSTYWGDAGYIRIARGELDCATSSDAGYPELAVMSEASIVV